MKTNLNRDAIIKVKLFWFFVFQFQPEVQSLEPLSVDVSPSSVVAVKKSTSPKGRALRQLPEQAFEPLVEQTQDSVKQQVPAETQEAKVTTLASKATKVSVRQGKLSGVSFKSDDHRLKIKKEGYLCIYIVNTQRLKVIRIFEKNLNFKSDYIR